MGRKLETNVAGRSKDDRPVGPDTGANGANGAKQDRVPAPSGAAGEQAPGELELHALGELELRALGELDQTLADRDQTGADTDQTAADTDQTAADDDQAASNDDQAASDRLLRRGGDSTAHEASRDVRDRGSARRQQTARERVDAASVRDVTAADRDFAAAARDEAAAQWDRELARREAAGTQSEPALKAIVLRALESRRAAAADRVAAAEGRARAAADREQAARDRAQAARDRKQAAQDRAELAHQLAIAETDELTGARARSAGLEELEHEVDRAHRTASELVVGYVDVVGLKAVNDTAGHAAGDALLRRAVAVLRSHMRSYDLIVRLGGDEFLCVLSDISPAIAVERFSAIQAELAEDDSAPRIRVGVAQLMPHDTAAELIERADGELPLGSR